MANFNKYSVGQVEPFATYVSPVLRGGEVARPHLDAETHFESGDSDCLDPRRATENLGDKRVVDTGLPSNEPEASTSNGLFQVDGDVAHELGSRVAARHDWPQRTADVGRVALGSDHDLSVVRGEITNTTCTSEDLELRSTLPTGVSYHHSGLTEEVVTKINIYTPHLLAEDWDAIKGFVRQAVADSKPRRVDTAHNMLMCATRLSHWCHAVACYELTYEVVFNIDTIERFVDQMRSDNPHTKGTYRSRLIAMANQLVGPQGSSYRHKQFPRSTAPNAYSGEEQIDLRTIRNNQATEYRRVNLGVFLALGAGAGISSGEMNRIRQSHVRKEGGGFIVDVLGTNRRNRTVPILAAWEDLLVPALDSSLPEGWVFLPRRVLEVSPNAVTRFISSCNSVSTHPTIWRLRATWLVTHLNAGTPLPDLLEVAGYEGLAKFERLLPFLERYESSERLSKMRLGGDAS